MVLECRVKCNSGVFTEAGPSVISPRSLDCVLEFCAKRAGYETATVFGWSFYYKEIPPLPTRWTFWSDLEIPLANIKAVEDCAAPHEAR